MLAKMYLKELKQFFRKPFNILFMLVTPICLILLMGYAMSNIIGTTKGTASTNNTALYIVEDGSNESDKKDFLDFRNYTEKAMNIKFIVAFDLKNAYENVDSSNSIALLHLSNKGFHYYRSPYNEPTESKLLRSAYNSLLGSTENLASNNIETIEVNQKTIDSYTYFTFAELGLIMMYLSLIVGQSVFREKEIKTFERIFISKASINNMIIIKIALGCTIGIIQILLVFIVSSLILNVTLGKYFILIFLLYFMLSIFSSTLGAIIGLFTKKITTLNDKILTIAIFISLLGGGLTPLPFLESIKIVSILCKISPLYWITNSAISLSSGNINNEFVIAIMVCLILTTFIVIIYLINKKKEKIKGVYAYE